METQVVTPSIYRTTVCQSSHLGQDDNVRDLSFAKRARPRLNPPHVTTAHKHRVAVCWPRTRVDPHMSAINSSGVSAGDGWLGVAAGVLVERHVGRGSARHDRSAHVRQLRRASAYLSLIGQHGDIIDARIEECRDRRKHLGPRCDSGLPAIERLLAKAELGGNFRFSHPACVLPVPQHLRQARVLFIGHGGSFAFYHLDKFVTMTYKPRTMPTDLTNLLTLVNAVRAVKFQQEERMMSIYLNDWAPDHNYNGTGLDGVKSDFKIGDDALVGVEIILASYTYEDYSGDAFVLFRKDGQLFEVNGGHCSCYGLEGQWEPEETSVEALRHRLAGNFGTTYVCDGKGTRKNVFAAELSAALAGISA